MFTHYLPFAKEVQARTPRERFAKTGVKSRSNSELLAIFLRTGLPGFGVLALADQLLSGSQEFGRSMPANETELTSCRDIESAKSAQLS